MKLMKSTIAILLLLCSTAGASAGEEEAVSFGRTFADSNCAWCHGPSGQGYATAPKLAGQRAPYIETQLRSFNIHSRDNPFSQQYMWPAAANLTAQEAHALAAYFSSLCPEPTRDGYGQLAPAGETLYRGGSPASNIPSCVACHGPECPRDQSHSSLGRTILLLLEKKARSMGRGLSCDRRRPNAGHCE